MRIRVFIVIPLVLFILVSWAQHIQAAIVEMNIQQYKHKGCILDPTVHPLAPNVHYPPRDAHRATPITFWYREDRREAKREFDDCRSFFQLQKTSCDLVIDYPGYLPSASRKECEAQYVKEVPICRAHYDKKILECSALKSPISRKTHMQDDKKDEKKHSQWEELEPDDTLAPGWEELTPDTEYGAEATTLGPTKRKKSRIGLLRNLKSKHVSAARGSLHRKLDDSQANRKKNSSLEQAALNQGYANFLQSITKLAGPMRSGSDGQSHAADERCSGVADQIAERMGSTVPSQSGGIGACAAGREQLRILTYAKDNLSRNGCYSGEYDQVISKTRNYITQVC